jgi:hypothetical protein
LRRQIVGRGLARIGPALPEGPVAQHGIEIAILVDVAEGHGMGDHRVAGRHAIQGRVLEAPIPLQQEVDAVAVSREVEVEPTVVAA